MQGAQKAWREQGFELILSPLSMGSLISSYETLGPAQIPPKRDFLFRQCLRRAKRSGIPLHTPARLPFHPGEVLRLGTSALGGVHQTRIIDVLFNAVWRDRIDMEDESALKNYLNDQLDDSIESFLTPQKLKLARSELKENFKKAKACGAFGVPSFVVQDELFWGHDVLEDLSLFLEGKDNLDKQEYQRFLELF